MERGVNILADTVKVTLGPKGRNVVIAKSYKNEEELFNDNDVNIYFDKKYDTTNYGILDDYENEMFNMTPENFIKTYGELLDTEKDRKQSYKMFNPDDNFDPEIFINKLNYGST